MSTTYSDLSYLMTKTSIGDINVVEDSDSIRQSIITILNTTRGSRVMRPHFGCYLKQYLFEPITAFVGEEIGEEIKSALESQEKRIVITNITVQIDVEAGAYDVSISYVPVNSKRVENTSLVLRKI